MTEAHWLTGETVKEEETAQWILGMNRSYFLLGLKSAGMFLLLFLILTTNFLALSVALQCNRKTQRQTPVAIFAFFFGPIYLIVHYYFIRVVSEGKDCAFSNINPFPYF